MILKIDTSLVDLYYEQTTQLDGIEYLMRFIWVDREGCWYLGIYDQNNNPIAVGIRLVVTWSLLRRFVDPRLPTGALLCVDLTGMNQDIVEPTDLGTRVILVYITADDPILAA